MPQLKNKLSIVNGTLCAHTALPLNPTLMHTNSLALNMKALGPFATSRTARKTTEHSIQQDLNLHINLVRPLPQHFIDIGFNSILSDTSTSYRLRFHKNFQPQIVDRH